MPPSLNKKALPTCVATSSNCVVWAGPAIPALGICEGDNLTHSLYQLAQTLLDSSAGLVDVTSLKFACLVEKKQDDPETLTQVIQLLINKVCTLDEAVEEAAEDPDGNPATDDGLLRLPECLQYETVDQDLVVSLPHLDYSKKLAAEICKLIATGKEELTAFKALVKRVGNLEKTLRQLGLEPKDITVHLEKLLTEPGEAKLQDAFKLVEDLLVDLSQSVGKNEQVLQAISQQCLDLGEQLQLDARERKLQDIVGWVKEPQNLADTITNLWLTLCDLRKSVIKIASVLTAGCNDVLLDFEFTPSLDGQKGTLVLYGKTILPMNFTSSETSRLVITDGVSTLSYPVDVFLLTRTSTQKLELSLTATDPISQKPLDLTELLSFTLIADLVDENQETCSKERERLIRPICDPKPVTASGLELTPSFTGTKIKWKAPLAARAPKKYKVEVLPLAGPVVVVPTEPAEPAEPTTPGTPVDVPPPAAVDPLFSATVSATEVVVPEGTLVHSTDYTITILPLYDCGESTLFTTNVRTLVCGAITLLCKLTDTSIEDDENATSPYLKVNGQIVPINAEEALPISSDCTGKLVVEYALSDSQYIENEQGELLLDGQRVGVFLKMSSGEGFLVGEPLNLTDLDPEVEHTLEFVLTTEGAPADFEPPVEPTPDPEPSNPDVPPVYDGSTDL